MANEYSRKVNGMAEEDSTIDIFRVFRLMLKRAWLIILICVLSAALMFGLAWITHEDTYTSYASFSLIIRNSASTQAGTGTESSTEIPGQPSALTSSDISIAEKLTASVRYLMYSDAVLDDISAGIGHKLTARGLKNVLVISSVDQTPFISLRVTTTDPKLSKQVAQETLKVLNEYVPVQLGEVERLETLNTPKEGTLDSSATMKYFPLLGFFGALIVCFFVVFLMDMFSHTLKSVKDVQTLVGTTLLTTIPSAEKKRRKHSQPMRGLLIDSASASFPFVEAYKSLRTKIENLTARKGYRKYIITSAHQDEGKTTVAVNLAMALAQNGKSVIVIDCDLRKPAVMLTLTGKQDDSPGMLSAINGKTDWKDTVKYISSHGIFVIPSGGSAENAAELLNSPVLDEVIEGAEREFDYVLIDTPPTKVVTDALVIATRADATILVMKQDYSDVDSINDVIDDFSSSPAKVIGGVFNSADAGSFGSRYYAYRYGGKDGYRYYKSVK